MSPACRVSHAGAVAAEPVPADRRNFLVADVFPASRCATPDVPPSIRSPRVVIGLAKPPPPPPPAPVLASANRSTLDGDEGRKNDHGASTWPATVTVTVQNRKPVCPA